MFWRRLAATWVDLFVVYAIAVFLVSVADITGLRIALDPTFLVLAAVYGVTLVARWGQTIGKLLLGIVVTSSAGDKLGLGNVVRRELLGKWGISVAAPIALGRGLMGQAWIATIYDLLILLPVLLLLLAQYLIAKRTWYDQLASTTVERALRSHRREKVAFVLLIGAAALGLGTTVTEFAARGWKPCRLAFTYQSTRSTAPYVAALKQVRVTPIDYIIGLFERHDVVVLCERIHSEGSQWDVVYEVVSDPRFIDRVGHVFTEYGHVGMQAYLDSFMATDGLAPGEVHDRVVHIMRNWSVWPVWNNTNVYTYLTRLYNLNQSLAPAKRIRSHFTDVPNDWKRLSTHEEYLVFRRSLGNRDEQMAQRIIEEMDRIGDSGSRTPKCLVVMNYRHAFDLTGRIPAAQRFNTFEYLKDAFGERAANVLLNTERPVSVLLNRRIAGGVWDAAFEEAGNRPVGFDFEGAPFGKDPFDLFPVRAELKAGLEYRDVFTGFVYTHRLADQYTQHGVPGYFQGFEKEALRRAELVSEEYRRRVQTLIDSEKNGDVMVKREVPARSFESRLDLSLFGVAGVGLLIGVGVFVLGGRRGGSQRRSA